jgi:hypothetical protein
MHCALALLPSLNSTNRREKNNPRYKTLSKTKVEAETLKNKNGNGAGAAKR